jgi:protein SCO1/2
MGRLAASLLIAAAAVIATGGNGIAQDVAPNPHFSLAAPGGGLVTERSYRGKWLLIYFGYTFCPDACPMALGEMAGALEALGDDAARVQALFITFDPRRDTSAVLATYVNSFDARIVGLTGAPAQTAAAARSFGVIYERQDQEGEGYSYDHSSFIYVVNDDGRLVERLSGGTEGAQIAQRLLADMRGGARP